VKAAEARQNRTYVSEAKYGASVRHRRTPLPVVANQPLRDPHQVRCLVRIMLKTCPETPESGRFSVCGGADALTPAGRRFKTWRRIGMQ